jgi:hypothetical protein
MDSATVSQKLIGSWIWRKQACMAIPLKDADKQVQVTFNANRSFIVIENSVTVSQGIWTLENTDIHLWALHLTAPSNYVNGPISFCNNQVEFNDSYRDGCYNLFTRSN